MKKELKNVVSNISNEYFVNCNKKYVFILTKLDGKQRNKLLGITKQMYEDHEIAQNWFKNIAKYIDPDVDKAAFIVLQRLYENMIKKYAYYIQR